MPTAKLSVNVIDLNISSLPYYNYGVMVLYYLVICKGMSVNRLNANDKLYFICSYHVTKVYLLAVMAYLPQKVL